MRIFDLFFALIIAAISMFLLSQIGYEVFTDYKAQNPNLVSFLAWALFFSLGKLLGSRLYFAKWQIAPINLVKAACWGLLGCIITFMYKFTTCGVITSIATGLIPSFGIGVFQDMLIAFYNSLFFHIVFGFLAYMFYKLIDYFIDYLFEKNKKNFTLFLQDMPLKDYILKISFFIIPIFSIPAFAIIMLFFPEFRDLFFIYFLIILGVFLTAFDKKIISLKLENYENEK